VTSLTGIRLLAGLI